MLRRTQTIYVAVDPFFSPRGKVLHHFDQFLAEAAQAQIPCVWMSGWTRAQLDEPRRRLEQNDPYIGENGCGVYLPEDYFHLKGSHTIRLGRYTCIPVAKPQPAAAEALEELSSDLDVAVVPLRKLSQRELSQNTGLPEKEAELIRLRDFDELFFFAGASETDIERFRTEANRRGLALQNAGQFWSLSCGANLAKCVRELGGLYDRALRSHALRTGLRVLPSDENKQPLEQDAWPASAFDRTLLLGQRSRRDDAAVVSDSGGPENTAEGTRESERPEDGSHAAKMDASTKPSRFNLNSPDVWTELMNSITAPSGPRRGVPG